MGKEGSNMIFVMGIPRSGTTWVHRLLCAHPSCRMAGPEAFGFVPRWPTRESGLFVRGLTEAEIRAKVGALDSGVTWVEKTPTHVLWAGRIWRMFPGARLVLVERDVRDVVWSMMNSKSPDGIFPESFELAMTRVMIYKRALAAFNGWTVRVQYEELHCGLTARVREVYLALGLSAVDMEIQRAALVATGAAGLPEGLKWCIRSGRVGEGAANLTAAELAEIERQEERGW